MKLEEKKKDKQMIKITATSYKKASVIRISLPDHVHHHIQ